MSTILVDSGRSRTRQLGWLAIAGWLANVTYCVIGALHILVWNPLASAPLRTLSEIRGDLAAAGESLGTPWVAAWALWQVGIASAILLVALLSRWPRRRTASAHLAVLALGAIGLAFASFPAGMSLADTYYIRGGDHAPAGAVLYLVSASALIALLVLGTLGRLVTNRKEVVGSGT